MIKKYVSDNSNMFSTLKEFPEQIKLVWYDRIIAKSGNHKINSVIVSGLGGSAISGDVASSFFNDELKIPFFVNRNYTLPAFANNKTLVITCSYSGNTEETISAYKEAQNKGCLVAVISSGGTLEQLANENGNLFIRVPKGFQPRCALGLMFFSLVKTMNYYGIVNLTDSDVDSIYDYFYDRSKDYSVESGLPFSIAEKLIGRFPIIHSSDLLAPINVRFRCQIAENAKMLGYSGILPELNHNEIIGWETFNPQKFNAVLIQLLEDDDHKRIKLRFEITEEILNELGLEIIKLKSEADNFRLRFLDLIYFTDWVSYYLAVIRNVDPTTIGNINRLKNALAKIED